MENDLELYIRIVDAFIESAPQEVRIRIEQAIKLVMVAKELELKGEKGVRLLIGSVFVEGIRYAQRLMKSAADNGGLEVFLASETPSTEDVAAAVSKIEQGVIKSKS